MTVPSSFLRAPSPGHVRKDYGRSHPPEAPCPAQVCTSAPLAGLRAPHSSAPRGFSWGPRHTAHLAGAPTPSPHSCSLCRFPQGPSPRTTKGLPFGRVPLRVPLPRRGRSPAVRSARVPTQHLPERAVTGSVLLLILTSKCPPTGLWVSCGPGPHFLSINSFL